MTLPSASFRFHLAVDTLAVQLEISTATLSRVLLPLAMNHASHTKNTPSMKTGEKAASVLAVKHTVRLSGVFKDITP